MDKFSLNGDWRVSFSHPETNEFHSIAAAVPGNIELDLERAGLIEDALPCDDEFACHWVTLADWDFEKEFVFEGMPPNKVKAMLKFDGIDTAADIFLNGEKIMYCENMHITHSKDVTDLLKVGVNKLLVRIYAPEIAARKYHHTAFSFSTRMDSLYLRKARHEWGWDNSPRRLTAGIWRDVSIEFLDAIRFESLYVATDWIDYANDKAFMTCHYRFETPDRDLTKYSLTARMVRNGKTEMEYTGDVRHTNGMLSLSRIAVEHPALWNPVGFGEPNLYDFILTLRKNGEIVAETSQRVGIRMIHLERTETTDAAGSGEFQFYCNGQKIYMRGTNWKPLSPYHSQTPERMQKALDLVLQCNCNMIRVWGGGIYEDHEFFDFCDEHGIMVWQDFMLACEFPPRDEIYCRKMYEEAAFIIQKLRNHPSLALWCGDNENDMFWGGNAGRTLPPSSSKITREIFPEAIREFDPWRDYVPSSPYISDLAVDRFKNQFESMASSIKFAPEQHVYCGNLPEGGFREFMRSSVAHFSSEIGPIFVNAMSEDPAIYGRELPRLKRLWNVDPATLPLPNDSIHQNDRYCANWCKAVKSVTFKMFGRDFSPENPEELCKAVNFYVADLFKYAIESWRIQKFRRTGILWWSLLDMWPMAFNYSMVDSNFVKKFPFESIRLSQQPFALIGEEPQFSTVPKLYAVNDTASTVKGTYKVTDFDGREIANGTFEVAPNGKEIIGRLPIAHKEACFIEWECGEFSGRNYFINYSEPYDFDYCTALMDKIRKL